VETVDQSVRSLLDASTVKGQGLAAMPMDTHHRLINISVRSSSTRAFCSSISVAARVTVSPSHLLHASGVETPRFESKLSQLHLGKREFKVAAGRSRQACLTLQQIPQMRQRGLLASCFSESHRVLRD